MESGARKHVTRDRTCFIDYAQFQLAYKSLHVNNRVCSYQLKLRSRHILIRQDMLYVLDVHHNLLSVVTPLGSDFTFRFSGNKLNIIWILTLYQIVLLN